MRSIEYVEYLDEDFTMIARSDIEGDQVLDFAVVLNRGGELITKWDCAHGMVHQDVYGKKGALVRKVQRVTFSLEEGFKHAVQDIKANYRRYAREYDARRATKR